MDSSSEWSISFQNMHLSVNEQVSSYPHEPCLSVLSQTNMILTQYTSIEDDGKSKLYELAKREFTTTSMSIFIVAMAFLSCTTVLHVRDRRAKFNGIVLKESNDKLEGLIWLLNCSIRMLESIDQS